jgi:tetratricopeptide (TPR) repeat protein
LFLKSHRREQVKHAKPDKKKRNGNIWKYKLTSFNYRAKEDVMKQPEFDLGVAHKYFAAECFNRAWDLIEKKDRSQEENDAMLALSMSSFWHWTQRSDHNAENISVAYWQLSRIFVLLDQSFNALRYGELCLAISKDPSLPPYCLGYAYEALARAHMKLGSTEKAMTYIEEAKKVSEDMKDPKTKKMLLADLETIL